MLTLATVGLRPSSASRSQASAVEATRGRRREGRSLRDLLELAREVLTFVAVIADDWVRVVSPYLLLAIAVAIVAAPRLTRRRRVAARPSERDGGDHPSTGYTASERLSKHGGQSHIITHRLLTSDSYGSATHWTSDLQ